MSDDFPLRHVSPADIHVITFGGRSIPAHSRILASASAVLESLVTQNRAVRILGAPHNSVVEFLRAIYASDAGPAAVNEHGAQLLALGHAYGVGWLKRRCEDGVRVGPADAVDLLKLAVLCDAPQLRRRCLAVAASEFAAVQRSDGWRFARGHDPGLELEVLRFVDERERRKRRWRREKAAQEAVLQLAHAMACLERVWCSQSEGTCHTCHALQLLMRHVAACSKKIGHRGGVCARCGRMWQLFRLHASLCQNQNACKVPFCRQFKNREEEEGKMKGDDATWKLLVKKVILARVMSMVAARKAPEELLNAWEKCRRNS